MKTRTDHSVIIPEIVYFATYVAIYDMRFYDAEWFRIEQYMKHHGFGNEVRNNVLSIIKNLDDKISLTEVINKLKEASFSNRREALKLAVKIAYADRYYSQTENSLIVQFCNETGFRKEYIKVDKSAESALLDDESKEFQKTLLERYKNSLFESQEYYQQLAVIEKVANEDIDYIQKEIGEIIGQIQAFPQKLERLLNGILVKGKQIKREEKEELKKFFGELISEEKKIIVETEQNLDRLLEHQNASSARYTISFMGRTKAGKSTLHSVLLGGINNDFIGQGAERTTRYNYIYDYNGIRIIDTPGIGAPGGEEDEFVAEGIADESDLVCYIVTTDSIQEKEFAFLAKLKNRHKPVIIILNNKDNFNRTSSKRNSFLSDPLYWYSRKDEKSIQGHIDRINIYIKKYYDYQNCYILPVHLLAAKEYITESDPDKKEKFLTGSRINEFLDSLYSLILKIGAVQKSQTIYRAGEFWIEEGYASVSQQMDELKTEKRIINENYNQTREKIVDLIKKTEEELKDTVSNVFEAFKADEIMQFSYDHYNDSQKQLDAEIHKLFENSCIEQRAKDEATRVLEDFQEKIEEYLEELQENIEIQMNLAGVNQIRSTKVVDIKFIMELISSGAGIAALILLAAFPPAGIAALVIAGVVAIIGLFFKSKEEKIPAARDKLYKALCDEVDIISDDCLKKSIQSFREVSMRIIDLLDLYYTNVLDSLNKTNSLLQSLAKRQNEKTNDLEKSFGIRILNFLTKRHLTDNDRFKIKGWSDRKQVNVKCIKKQIFEITANGLKKEDLFNSPEDLQVLMEERLKVKVSEG